MAATTSIRELPSSPRGLPLVGRALEYSRDPIALFRRQWADYGAVSPLRMVGGSEWAIVLRQAVKDTTVLDTRITAGTPVIVALQFAHLMPEHWSAPERFDPERFHPSRREDRSHRYAWAPFGGGVHKCLGMHFAGVEVKAVLYRLLQDFTWHVDPSYVAPLNNHSLPFPRDGQPIALRRR